MSNQVFPTLPGLGWSMIKIPQWRTKIQSAASGKEYRSSFFSYPIYQIKLTYEILRATTALPELQQLIGLFNLMQGSFDNFLYSDPTDNSVTAQALGVGDGTTTKFQLVRAYGANTEPVMNVNAIAGVYLNGVATTAYTIDSYGLITFTTAPLAAVVITWTGTYYYRCRFVADSNEFENFMYQLWFIKSLDLYGCLGNKI